MDNQTTKQLLDYVSKGIQKGLLTTDEATKALQTLGISFGPVMQNLNTLDFVRNIEYNFD